MPQRLSMSEAREQITRFPEEFACDPDLDAITITRRGEPVLAVMPWYLYESIRETLEIMSDPDLMEMLRVAVQQAASGQTVAWDIVKDMWSSG